MARRVRVVENPRNAKQVGIGQWIPAHAVRFNRDGTASVMTEGRKNRGRRRNVAAGWTEEETGIFHPIRASYDYSRSRAGEKAKKRPKAKKRRKAKAKTKRRR